LVKLLKTRRPLSVEICALLRKPDCLKVDNLHVRYLGVDIANEWVVGYGLDNNEFLRNLPVVGVLKRHTPREPIPRDDSVGQDVPNDYDRFMLSIHGKHPLNADQTAAVHRLLANGQISKLERRNLDAALNHGTTDPLFWESA
jgi:hypothetical protein